MRLARVVFPLHRTVVYIVRSIQLLLSSNLDQDLRVINELVCHAHHLTHDARPCRAQGVLHLHRLDHCEKTGHFEVSFLQMRVPNMSW